MIIKRIAVGNRTEAFIESSISSGLNIISSDENNKGKTIVIQSLMYALGNEPTFPSTFNYKDYYYYVEVEVHGVLYRICRLNKGFVLKCNTALRVFDTVSELKRYWDKNIFALPRITKNQHLKIVDPVLFLQLFFIGQDNKNTSTIMHAGLYNKADFYDMIYDICDLSGLELDENEIKRKKEQLEQLRTEREILIKQHKILKSRKLPISYLSPVNDRARFGKKLQDLDKITEMIAELRKSRNAAATRKASWETTLKELRSLNRTIECGQLRCMDCNSTNICLSSSGENGYSFEVTSADMRNEIVSSINEKIESYAEEMVSLSAQINKAQEEMKLMMKDDAISLEAIVAYKKDVFCASDAEAKIIEIDAQIEVLENQLTINASAAQSKREKQIAILGSLLTEMNAAYKTIDPHGNLHFDDLFTKRNEVFSGSEGIIFQLCKLYALSKILKHSFPIVVDSFRAEDLSTNKESVVIDLFKALPNQVVFTTTLKNEELGKYDGREGINHINYESHLDSKMLTTTFVEDFKSLLEPLLISL